MSEAAFTLSTAPIWSATHVRRYTAAIVQASNRGRTSLRDLRPNSRQLDEDNVSEARLRVVRDGNSAESGAVIEHHSFMVLRVFFGCQRATSKVRRRVHLVGR